MAGVIHEAEVVAMRSGWGEAWELAVAEGWAPAMEPAAERMATAEVVLEPAAAMARVAEATALVGVDWVAVAAEALADVEGARAWAVAARAVVARVTVAQAVAMVVGLEVRAVVL